MGGKKWDRGRLSWRKRRFEKKRGRPPVSELSATRLQGTAPRYLAVFTSPCFSGYDSNEHPGEVRVLIFKLNESEVEFEGREQGEGKYYLNWPHGDGGVEERWKIPLLLLCVRVWHFCPSSRHTSLLPPNLSSILWGKIQVLKAKKTKIQINKNGNRKGLWA